MSADKPTAAELLELGKAAADALRAFTVAVNKLGWDHPAVQASAADRDAADKALYRFRSAIRLSDEVLAHTAADTDPMASRGDKHAAPYLLKVPYRQRRRAEGEAQTLMNLIGGVYSGNVYNATQEIAKNIAAGDPDKELYGERTAREYREREEELRKITGNPAAIYYPPR
jgi:hypothetical protein